MSNPELAAEQAEAEKGPYKTIGLTRFHAKLAAEGKTEEWRAARAKNLRESWARRKNGPAYNVIPLAWRAFVDILPACKWDVRLALTKVSGLPKAAVKNFQTYLNHSPNLQRAIAEKREALCPSSVGVVQPGEIEESERIRKKVMEGFEHMMDFGEAEKTRLKAMEDLARTQGMFVDKEVHQVGMMDGGNAEAARERARKFVDSQQKPSESGA